jgi:hypothetical protein
MKKTNLMKNILMMKITLKTMKRERLGVIWKSKRKRLI